MVKIAASILSADFSRLAAQVQEAEAGGADYIHVDVMDGHFVPNLTIGPSVLSAFRPASKLPYDVHLMIESPEKYVQEFARAGADIITVHQEACIHLHRVIEQIKELGKRAGVAINPATPTGTLEQILPYVDLVLVMTVNPGFGGQSFIPTMPDKIAAVRKQMLDRNLGAELEVDGGITTDTVGRVVTAGANVLVAGSAVFRNPAGVAAAIHQLREAAQATLPPARGR